MKSLSKGLTLFLVVTLLLIVFATACSNNDEGSGTKDNNVQNDGDSDNGGGLNENDAADDLDFNPEGFPIVDEPITLKMFSRIAPISAPNEELTVWQEYEKMTGIKIEFEDVPTQGFQERKNLAFASNELPDFLFRSAINPLETIKYGSNGQIIPLEDLIDQYAPNFKALMEEYPEIKADITYPDGHIYSMPMIITVKASLTGKNWMNEAWLNELDLEMPTTTDELITVLKAFRDGDANGNGDTTDEIPLSFQTPSNADAGLMLVNQFAGSFGLERQFEYNANIEDGKVQLWVTDDRYKAQLQFLNELWEEKLIDPEYFTHTNAEYIAKMTSAKLGYFTWGNNNPFTAIADQITPVAPVEGPLGDRMYSNIGPMTRAFGAFAITSANEHPEETMRWVDYFYGKEGSTFIRYGVEGESFNYDENGEAVYVDSIMNDPKPDVVACTTITPFCGGAFPHWIHDKNDSLVNNAVNMEAQETIDPYLPEVKYGPLLFDEDTAREVDILRGDIDTYVREQSTKFIIGDISFDQWDTYVDTLKKMDIERLQEIYQQFFDVKS